MRVLARDDPSFIVAYFSGTGGTKRLAEGLVAGFESCGGAELQSLDLRYAERNGARMAELIPSLRAIVLLYAVHEMDAPKPVFEWIEGLPSGALPPFAVLSVSGGGEAWPNGGSRVNCIRALEGRGCEVIYERMMVMPSNVIMYTKPDVAMWLLRVVEAKTAAIARSVAALERRRDRQRRKFRAFSTSSRYYAECCAAFGRKFSVTEACSKCGSCVEDCPRGNIRMEGGAPLFGPDCVICLRCIYGCPNKAIKNKSPVGLLRNGFDLAALERKMDGLPLDPIEECCHGILWIGVRKYLLERD